RNLDRESGTRGGTRPELDGAPDQLDIVAHDVHADAASRHAADGLRRGKARPEDEFADIRVAQAVDLSLRCQAILDRFGADLLRVQPAYGRCDIDDDITVLLIR